MEEEEEEEEVVYFLSNQRPRCFISCAGAVRQIFHVQYVVSGGGHRRLSKTEVSYATQSVHVIKILNCIVKYFYSNTTQRTGDILLVIRKQR